ncbi:MAG: VWA domain-containing protein, partial [Bdellovibrionota bacterium]|nr:VWA domain-containing protein [Bdellovibrionota bacterium]
MKFANLQYLWCLIIIPLLVLFYIWAFKKKKRLLELFVSEDLKDKLLRGFSAKRQKVKAFLIIFAFFFCILALIRPKWGFQWEEVNRRGVDIILALDVSESMLAEDVSPNRLERAKREIIDLLNMMQGDRVGLVAFSGTSFLQSPLTLDYGAVRIFLDELDTDLIPVPGTAIGDAIKKSISAFDSQNKKSRVLILITDGE